MSVIYSQAQKQRYRITLELETMEDFDPHQISWEDLFELRRIWAGYWQLRRRPEHSCPVVIVTAIWQSLSVSTKGGRRKCSSYVSMTQNSMTTTFQTNLTDTTYNGWTNYETWNVALWLGNDEGLYNLARGFAEHGYKSLSHMLIEMSPETPDGVKWDDESLNVCELNEMLEELWYLAARGLTSVSPRDMMGESISEPQCF